jgi:hypothetical protein
MLESQVPSVSVTDTPTAAQSQPPYRNSLEVPPTLVVLCQIVSRETQQMCFEAAIFRRENVGNVTNATIDNQEANATIPPV